MARKSKKVTEPEVEEPSEELAAALISEEDLENSGLKELVDKGKERGFLTYEEINLMLPEDMHCIECGLDGENVADFHVTRHRLIVYVVGHVLGN